MCIALDFAELKLSRGSQRQKSLLKDREDYERLVANRSLTAQRERTRSVRASRRLAHPHRAARVAARSWLAKGGVQGESDMPSVSIGHPNRQKPSASRQRLHWEGCFENEWDEVNSDADTSAPDFSAKDGSSQASTPTLSFARADEIPGEPLAEESRNLDPLSPQSNMEMTFEESLIAFSYEVWQPSVGQCLYKAEVSKLISHPLQKRLNLSCGKVNERAEVAPVVFSSEQVAWDVEHQSRTRRESILKEIVTKLRIQAREAEVQAEEAQARALEMEQKMAAQKQHEEKEKRAATLKLAKSMDRQRAQKLHKQVEQERRKDEVQRNELEAVRAQAEEEKMAIRQQALSEVAAMKAKARAARAQVLAAAKAEAQMSACSEVKSLRAEAERLAESAQAEAASLRAQAETVAETVKAKAAADAKELLLKAEAERAESQLLAEAAEQHKLRLSYVLQAGLTLTHAKSDIIEEHASLTNRRESILKEIVGKLRHQAREAEQQAEDAKAQALDFQQKATAQQQKQEVVATLKLAKSIDRQRACKAKKQAVQDRCKAEAQRIELETLRVQTEGENRLIKQQALLEAAATKSKAKSDARAARARAISAAMVEAQERACAEAASLRAEAERVAEAIMTKAAADADQLLREAKAQKDIATAINSPLEEPAPLHGAAKDDLLDQAVDMLEEDWHVLSGTEVEDDGWDVLA